MTATNATIQANVPERGALRGFCLEVACSVSLRWRDASARSGQPKSGSTYRGSNGCGSENALLTQQGRAGPELNRRCVRRPEIRTWIRAAKPTGVDGIDGTQRNTKLSYETVRAEPAFDSHTMLGLFAGAVRLWLHTEVNELKALVIDDRGSSLSLRQSWAVGTGPF